MRGFLFSFAALFIVLAQPTQSLQLTRLRLDSPAENGSDVMLHCDFVAKRTNAFSVKYYKNNLEFYRWESPFTQKYYPLNGIHVDLKESNASHLLLKHVNPSTEGTFACEINTELPSFMSSKVERDLRIYVLAKQRLRLTRSTTQDLLNLTCISAPTRPATILSWFFNDLQMPESSHFSNVSTQVQAQGALYITQSQLLLRPDAVDFDQQGNHHFWLIGRVYRQKSVHIRCRSALSQISVQTFQQMKIYKNGKQPKFIKTETACHPSISLECKHPNISVKPSDLSLGQPVSVSCQGPRHQDPAPFLQWFLNEQLIASTPLLTSSAALDEPLVQSNEYLFSNIIQKRPAMQSSKSEPTKQEDPMNPNFQHSNQSTIYHHFAKMRPQLQHLNARFLVVKKLFQTLDASMTLRCVATFGQHIQRDQVSIQLIHDRTSYTFEDLPNKALRRTQPFWKIIFASIYLLFAVPLSLARTLDCTL